MRTITALARLALSTDETSSRRNPTRHKAARRYGAGASNAAESAVDGRAFRQARRAHSGAPVGRAAQDRGDNEIHRGDGDARCGQRGAAVGLDCHTNQWAGIHDRRDRRSGARAAPLPGSAGVGCALYRASPAGAGVLLPQAGASGSG